MVSVDHLHAPQVSVREQAAILVTALRRSRTATFRALTTDCEGTLVVVARFLALLELFREGAVVFEQVDPLGELHIRWTGTDEGDVEVPTSSTRRSSLRATTTAATTAATSPSPPTYRTTPRSTCGRRAPMTTPDEQPEREDDGVPLRTALEAILMVVDEPVGEVTLAQVAERPTEEVVAELRSLAAEYDEQGRGFELRQVAGGWRFYTRANAAAYVERFVLDGQQARLTQAALETLAVVAYRQPVSRARVSAVRGVNVDGVMRTLVARGLVEESGDEGESGATLYRTTSYFLERLGLRDIDELPDLAPTCPRWTPSTTWLGTPHELTTTTTRASGCSGCSPRPGSAAGAPASSSSRRAASRSTARRSWCRACASTRPRRSSRSTACASRPRRTTSTSR